MAWTAPGCISSGSHACISWGHCTSALKNCSPLLVKPRRGRRSNRVISRLYIFTVHVPWFSWSEFLVQMLKVSVLDAISPCSLTH